MKITEEYVKITPYLVTALKDWRTWVHHLVENPTLVQILVSEHPDYLRFTDTCLLISG